jgi:hypothetical protein
MNVESDGIREMAETLRIATVRYWEIPDEGIVLLADSVVKHRASIRSSLDDAVRAVAKSRGEDWRVVLAAFRTVHPAPASSRNPIAQDREGNPRRELVISFHDDDAPAA